MSTITGTAATRLATAAPAGDQPDTTLDATTHAPRLTTLWTILRFTYGLVPIVAGLDKFTNILVDWKIYLNPMILDVLPLSAGVFMGIVGVIEILAGILTLVHPRLGGFVVMAWLVAIALSLIVSGRFFDVAVRDLVMAIGAFVLASLSAIVDRSSTGEPQ